jgi:serine/threonine-protein kinase SRPK3
LKVYASEDYQSAHELKIFEHLKTTDRPNQAWHVIRTLRDSFEIPGETGSHQCLVHSPLGMTLKEGREMVEEGKMDVEMIQPIIYYLLFAVRFLHTEANLVHAGMFAKY